MSCDIPNSYPSKLLPNIPDFYNGVIDGIERLGASTTGPLKIIGAAGSVLGGYDSYATFVNDIYRREPISKYAIDLTSVAGAVVGGVAGLMVVGLLLPEIGIASLIVLGTEAAGVAVGSSIGGDLGSKLGRALFDPVPEAKYIDSLLKNR